MWLGLGLRLAPALIRTLVYNIAAQFAPALPGLWADPSDYAAQSQDGVGYTPVTAVAQPSGLIRDKRLSQGFVAAAGFTFTRTAGDGVLSVVGNQITITGATAATFITINSDMPLAVGQAKMVLRADHVGATGVQFWLRGGPDLLVNGVTKTYINGLGNSTLERLDVGTGTVTFTLFELSHWRGNHLSQSTAAARPVTNARVNRLIKTEDFADAYWAKNGVTLTANAATAPDGTMTATLLAGTAVNGFHTVGSGAFTALTGVNCGRRISVKAAGCNFAQISSIDNVNSGGCFVNLLTGAVGVISGTGLTVTTLNKGNGWWEIECHRVSADPANYFNVSPSKADGDSSFFAGNGSDGILVWQPQAVVGPTLGKYQRVNTALDYDTVGFPAFLTFDGVDDGMSTGTLTLSADMDCFIAVRRNSAAQTLMAFSPAGSFFGVAALGVLSPAEGGSGSPTYVANGVPVNGGLTGTTRDQLHTALTVGSWVVLEVRNLSLTTGWAGSSFAIGNYTGFTLNGDIAGIILCPAGDAVVRQKNRQFLGTKVGLTLP